MAQKWWLTRGHMEILAAIQQAARWDSPNRDGWIRKRVGMNARSLHVLWKLGLLESRGVQGPRGGRYLELRLTQDGKSLLLHVQDTIEGTGPQDEHGNQIRVLRLTHATFQWEESLR